MAEKCPIACKEHILFLQSFIDKHLGCFYLLAIVTHFQVEVLCDQIKMATNSGTPLPWESGVDVPSHGIQVGSRAASQIQHSRTEMCPDWTNGRLALPVQSGTTKWQRPRVWSVLSTAPAEPGFPAIPDQAPDVWRKTPRPFRLALPPGVKGTPVRSTHSPRIPQQSQA